MALGIMLPFDSVSTREVIVGYTGGFLITVGIREIKNRLSEYLRGPRLENGLS